MQHLLSEEAIQVAVNTVFALSKNVNEYGYKFSDDNGLVKRAVVRQMFMSNCYPLQEFCDAKGMEANAIECWLMYEKLASFLTPLFLDFVESELSEVLYARVAQCAREVNQMTVVDNMIDDYMQSQDI